ncbi:excinuclease ABC subunit UvrC [Phycicoccus endophyticus]|uniref:UvrABC system protein C n=1 Tax=Phycicoccus endophyticus TaxID=1690220 RepID=A0A7G9R4D2_9MICO|nr:excinuclease ABC subunit UvrC [Phycicoccus endophyticus]NHI18326.1 excinuclease ABC subunit UvrC [Phycicoccus endophyticus]QNN50457.1 excinuclease ABC subunit UvrC [Phycicoccus endophyticus]GGL24660.1 UvrABC system protein C [Phycicoccus endophyticus]
MADPSTYRPAPGEIPTEPGVYRFRDREGRVIYVGKAKNLRQRLSSYFQDVAALHHRTATMVRTGASVEWTVVTTEVEALQLEYAWIKEFDPRFNVRYRDDKSYPYLAVTMGEEFPRAMVMRGAKRKGTRYFGPYAHAWAIRETLDLAMRVFPMRTCSTGVFKRAGQVGRPCLLGYIDKCSAPCVGRVDAAHHRAIAEDFCDFMAGNSGKFLTRMTREMRQAAAELDYERAARLRDDIGALERVLEKSAVVLPDATDADVFGLAEDELEVAVQLFHVRGGRVRGQRGWVAERDAETTPEVVEHLLQQVYGGESAEGVPREVLVPVLPEDAGALGAWLAGIRGSRVDLRVPQRGDKRTLMETVARNASQSLARHKVTRAGDLTTRSQALQQLQEMLDLDDAPLRVECFDISHVQGTQVVGSMVVFEDGLPRKSEYRRFVVRGDETGATDDTAAMHEVLTRRFRRGRQEAAERDQDVAEGRERPARFAYTPNLVVVDGGLPQVNAAARALEEVGAVDVAVVGLAKRLEEVWLPGEEHPVVLPRSSEGLYLLQRLRDEAHRFAITFHRQRRSTAMTRSALDAVPGLGEKRRQALLKRFGSVKRIRAASLEELIEVPGIGPGLAATVAAELGSAEPELPAVDPVTGEVVEDEGARRG